MDFQAQEMVDCGSPLTEELMLQYRKVFSLYGKEEKGIIYPKDLGIAMRSLGYNPTEPELQVNLGDYNQ